MFQLSDVSISHEHRVVNRNITSLENCIKIKNIYAHIEHISLSSVKQRSALLDTSSEPSEPIYRTPRPGRERRYIKEAEARHSSELTEKITAALGLEDKGNTNKKESPEDGKQRPEST